MEQLGSEARNASGTMVEGPPHQDRKEFGALFAVNEDAEKVSGVRSAMIRAMSSEVQAGGDGEAHVDEEPTWKPLQ